MMEWCGFVRKDHNSKKNLNVKVLDFVKSDGPTQQETQVRLSVSLSVVPVKGTTWRA